VANISPRLTSEQVKEALQKVTGPIQSLVLKQGYGFVTYENHRKSEKAMALLKGHVLDGQMLKVQLAASRERRVGYPTYSLTLLNSVRC